MHKTEIDPANWIAAFPDDIRPEMAALDALISEAMPDVPRTVWEGVFWGGSEQSILGYGDLMQTQSRGRVVEWFMVGLARQKKHISIYVNAVEDRRYVAETYADQLGKAKVGKSSIGFRTLDDLNQDTLRRVLAVAHRQLVAESRSNPSAEGDS